MADWVSPSASAPNPQAAAVGDAPQWKAIALRYEAPLKGFFAKRVRNAADVDDLVQEVFVRLIGRGRGQPIERIEQYLFQTAANVLRDRNRRRVAREQDAHEPLEEDHWPSQAVD